MDDELSCGAAGSMGAGLMLAFPTAFHQLLLYLLAERSPSIRGQLECVGADGSYVDLPQEETTLWLQCIFDPCLQSKSDFTLVKFLMVHYLQP